MKHRTWAVTIAAALVFVAVPHGLTAAVHAVEITFYEKPDGSCDHEVNAVTTGNVLTISRSRDLVLWAATNYGRLDANNNTISKCKKPQEVVFCTYGQGQWDDNLFASCQSRGRRRVTMNRSVTLASGEFVWVTCRGRKRPEPKIPAKFAILTGTNACPTNPPKSHKENIPLEHVIDIEIVP